MDDHYWSFHLFGAHFASEAEARLFAFEQWEPEPGHEVSDEEYAAWEDRNPGWLLADELGYYMDSDFIELVDDLDYVQSQLRAEVDRHQVALQGRGFSHYLLIALDAIYGDRLSDDPHRPLRAPQSTATLSYLGLFNKG